MKPNGKDGTFQDNSICLNYSINPIEGFSIHPVSYPIYSDSRQQIRALLKKHKYQLYGKNIAVKKCLWTHKALRDEDFTVLEKISANIDEEALQVQLEKFETETET